MKAMLTYRVVGPFAYAVILQVQNLSIPADLVYHEVGKPSTDQLPALLLLSQVIRLIIMTYLFLTSPCHPSLADET